MKIMELVIAGILAINTQVFALSRLVLELYSDRLETQIYVDGYAESDPVSDEMRQYAADLETAMKETSQAIEALNSEMRNE